MKAHDSPIHRQVGSGLWFLMTLIVQWGVRPQGKIFHVRLERKLKLLCWWCWQKILITGGFPQVRPEDEIRGDLEIVASHSIEHVSILFIYLLFSVDTICHLFKFSRKEIRGFDSKDFIEIPSGKSWLGNADKVQRSCTSSLRFRLQIALGSYTNLDK